MLHPIRARAIPNGFWGTFCFFAIVSEFAGWGSAQEIAPGIGSTIGNGWTLVWHDEFLGPKLDYSKWEIEVNAFGGGNQELQIYTDRPENVRIDRGRLILEARNDKASVQGTVRDYSSGRIRSKNRGDWQYGRFEIRAKFPRGQGLWPAIWMMPTAEAYGTWAASGEIDIVEYKGQEPNVVHGTLHYGSTWPNNKFTGTKYKLTNGNFADEFHDFALEWEPGEIRWYVDSQLYQTQNKWDSDGGPFPAPFDQEFHLVLNMAVGGGFVGSPDDKTAFPAHMEVDYVRVYQKSQKAKIGGDRPQTKGQ